jgi:hypothetical protein
MTSIGRLANNSFENNPAAELTRVDPYDPSEIQRISQAQPLTEREMSTLADKIPPDEIARMQNDPVLQAKLQASGLTLPQYAAAMENKLPRGLDLKTTMANGIGLKDIDRDMDRLKDRIKAREAGFAPSKVLSSLKFMKNAGKIVDLDFYKDGLDKAREYGINLPFGDEVTESGLTLGIIDGILEYSSKSDIWQYIEGTPLGDKFKNYIVTEGIEIAAKKGSYTSVRSVIQNYPGEVSMNLRYKCIGLIMENFRVGDENLDQGYRTAARRVVNDFNYIFPAWEKILINSPNRGEYYLNSHNHFLGANEGMLTLLKYNDINYDGIDVASTIQIDKMYKREPMTTAVARSNPTVYIP